MASVAFYLDTRSARKDGTHALKLRISHLQRSFFVPLNIYLDLSQWDVKKEKIISHPKKDTWNAFILKERIKVSDKLLELKAVGGIDDLTIGELKDHITGKNMQSFRSFKDYAEYFAGTHAKPGARRLYAETLRAIGKFTNLDRLQFKDITPIWLREFDKFMESTGRGACPGYPHA